MASSGGAAPGEGSASARAREEAEAPGGAPRANTSACFFVRCVRFRFLRPTRVSITCRARARFKRVAARFNVPVEACNRRRGREEERACGGSARRRRAAERPRRS
eukprot:1184917-Prorocentrum_minimum.AAC.2